MIAELLDHGRITELAVRTLNNRLTEEDKQYLQEHCDVQVQETYMDEGGFLDFNFIRDGEHDNFAIEPDCEYEDDTYAASAYFTVIASLLGQLPSWVFNLDQFEFNWASLKDTKAEDLDELLGEAFEIIFDNSRNIPVGSLDPSHIFSGQPEDRIMNEMYHQEFDKFAVYREMFNYLPGWVSEDNGNVDLSAKTLKYLDSIYDGEFSKTLQAAERSINNSEQLCKCSVQMLLSNGCACAGK